MGRYFSLDKLFSTEGKNENKSLHTHKYEVWLIDHILLVITRRNLCMHIRTSLHKVVIPRDEMFEWCHHVENVFEV